MMKFPQWEDAHCPVAGQGSEPLLLMTEKLVCLAVYSYCSFKIFIYFNVSVSWNQSEFSYSVPWSSVFSDWSSSCGLDLAFKTPIRPIMRHQRILSEINSVPPRNSTARNIYSPIVRFLTPSKESKYRYWGCRTLNMDGQSHHQLVFWDD